MATSKVVRLSSKLLAMAPKLCKNSLSSEIPLPKVNSRASLFDSATRIGRTSRLPVELSSQESLMPLHSAIASARLISSLTTESQSWGLVPQGWGRVQIMLQGGCKLGYFNAFMTAAPASHTFMVVYNSSHYGIYTSADSRGYCDQVFMQGIMP